MKLSIIIPFYDGVKKIGKGLESILSQGWDKDDYEVIYVDDCSPEALTLSDIQITPPLCNIRIIRTLQNRRQGGARNEGVIHARGQWIMFIDQDDWWEPGALDKVFQRIDSSGDGLDMVMTDHFFHNGRDSFQSRYSRNSETIYSGVEFIKNEEFTWAPWGYAYRRDFLLNHNLKFEEHVRFEDADFVIRCISHARKICYCPVSLVHYSCYEDSQTGFGYNTIGVIDQIMQYGYRIQKEIIHLSLYDSAAGDVIRHQAFAAFKIGMRRFIWLSYADVLFLTRKYVKGNFNFRDDFYLGFASAFPKLYTMTVAALSPLLRQIVKFKRWKRNR